jgi:ketosteroid isomerase-like protein
MKMMHRKLGAVLSFALMMAPVAAVETPSEPQIAAETHFQGEQADRAALAVQLDRWRQLYGYGDKPFSFSGFEDLYVPDARLTAFDNFAPKDTYLSGWDSYRTLWEPLINSAFTGQVITRFDIVRSEVSGDLAWTAISFWFEAKRDGKPFASSQHATHIWHRIDGEWRIVHEHIMGPIIVEGRAIRPAGAK